MPSLRVGALCRAMMSSGNKKLVYQDNTYNQSRQSGIWYFYPNFIGIFLVFYQYFEYDLRKIILVGIFRQKKNLLNLVSVVAIHWYRLGFGLSLP